MTCSGPNSADDLGGEAIVVRRVGIPEDDETPKTYSSGGRTPPAITL